MLCKYKDALGPSRVGIRKFRIFDISIVDVLGTVLLAFVVMKFLHINFYTSLFITFVTGLVSHEIFCVDNRLKISNIIK